MKTYKVEFFYGDQIHAAYFQEESSVRNLVNYLYSGECPDFPLTYDKFGHLEKEPNDIRVRELDSLPEGCGLSDKFFAKKT